MIEAANTSASTFEIWAIVIVATCCLAFWLTMVVLADRRQVKDSGLTPLPRDLALGEAQAGAVQRDLPAGFEMPGQRTSEAPAEPARADAPTRADLPVQPGMPAQRSGEGDRAERSGTAERDQR